MESEVMRIERVQEYLTLDLSAINELHEIVSLASEICEKPISLITLLDENINWIKASAGVDMKFAPSETSFCQHVIKNNDILVVQDAKQDSRFDGNPLVYDQPE